MNRYIDKKARAIDQVIGHLASGKLSRILMKTSPTLGISTSVPEAVGQVAGLVAPASTKAQQKQYDQLASFIPGVGTYRLNRRLKRINKAKDKTTKRTYSQALGPITSALLSISAGAGAGLLYNKLKGETGSDAPFAGAVVGGGAALLASLGALVIAANTPTRTAQQQEAYANSGIEQGLTEYLIPGTALYNKYKSIGRILRQQEDAQKGN